MGRRCSYCGDVGHNSRTCTMMQKMRGGGGHVGHGGVRLFGVQLLANLSSSSSSSSSTSSLIVTSKIKSCSMDCLDEFNPEKMSSNNNINGYLNHGALTPLEQERNRGMPWSEEEHRMFLIGLHKLGKGDWRGISRNFVTTRTSTQVASHAQKYFLRKNHNLLNKRKRRPSLFDEDKDELFLAQLINANNITSNNIANEAAASTKSNKIPYGFSTKAMSTINGVQYSTKWKCKCDTAKVDVIGETFNESTTSFNISQQPTTISSTLTHQHQKLPSHLDPIRAAAAAAEEAEVPDLELKLAA